MAKVALLIGVSEYEPGLNPLPAAVKDVEAIRELLLHPEIGDFAEADVIMLKNPGRQEMEEAIEALFAGRHKDDLVMLFFSGHGIKDDAGRLFLANRGTRKTLQGDLIRSTAVSSALLHDSMGRSRSKRQVVILDSCFSGAFAEGMSAKDDGTVDIRAQLGGEGRAVLTSSSSTQYSFEYEGSALSLYTRFLVEGIQTGAADQDEDEVISIDELHEYASKRVREIKPEAKPEIFASREGFNIRLMRVPPGDPTQKYRKEVARYIRRGEISLIGRRTLNWKRTELGLENAEAKAIEDEVLEPYRQKFQEKIRQYEQAFTDLLQQHETIDEEDRNDLQRLQQELELRNEDTLPIEAKVTLQFKVHQQKLRDYERAFTEAIQQEYPLSQQTLRALQQLRSQLQLIDTDVTAIETRIAAETETYHRNLEQYRQSFATAVQEQYPLSDAKRQELRQQQQTLGLQDIDVAPIEAQLTTERENYQQKLAIYEQALVKATQRKLRPSETVRAQLQQTWQTLALGEADIKTVEDRVMAEIDRHQTNLQQYEQAFINAIKRQYPLSQAQLQELRQHQQALNLADGDIAAMQNRAIAAIEEKLNKLQQYEQVFSDAIRYEYPLTIETRDELKRFQQILDLSDETVRQIETRTLSSSQVALKSGDLHSGSNAATVNQPQSSLDSRLMPFAAPLERQSAQYQQESQQNSLQQQESQREKSRSTVQQALKQQQTQPSQNYLQTRSHALKQTLFRALSRQPRQVRLFPTLAIASLLLVVGLWSLTKTTPTATSPTASSPTTINNLSPALPAQKQSNLVQERTSIGEKILINRETVNANNATFEAAKQRGVTAMAKGDYQQAIAEFTKALQASPNAPETLIYLNNAQIGSEKSYTIAVSVPITGPNPGNALEMLRGFVQAQNEINQAGGINGIKLRLKIFDDSDDPEIAKQIASVIVHDPEILAVLGHWSSPTTLATAPIYNTGKTVLITPISTVVELSNFQPYVFRTNLTTETGAEALANYATTRLQQKNIAVFFDSKSAYSQELESYFKADIQQASGRITHRFDLSDSSLSIASSIDQAIQQGAQAILIAPSPASLDKALQVITTNHQRLPLLGDVANLYAPKTLEVGGQDAEGMVMAIPWHINGNPNSTFARQSSKLWNADTNWATAMSYNAAQALVEALEQATNPSRAGIQNALTTANFSAEGVSGAFRFSAAGDAGTSVQFVEVRAARSSGSNVRYEFVPVR